MLVLALILGTLTVYFTRSIIQNQRQAEVVTTTAVEEKAELASVVVAVLPMKFGDEITSEKLRIVSWPAEIRPEGSFENIGDILGSERRVVLRSIGKNEPITKEKISGFGSRASLAQVIEKGYRATSVPINQVKSVSGFILPGDRVDVMLTFKDTSYGKKFVSNIILQDKRVLAIDQLSDESAGGTIVGSTATLEVTPEDAQKLTLATKVGSLSLILIRMSPQDEEAQFKSKTIYVRDLKPSVPEKPLIEENKTKTGKRTYVAKRPAAAKPVNPLTDMKITRGTRETKSKVLVEEVLESKKKQKSISLSGDTPSP
jgi:pilus assembly protein CpaB